MTKDEFADFWIKNYPETLPINYLFKNVYRDNWLRIHSLPKSKRYAESKAEMDIILSRQNTIIGDLIPQNSGIQVVVNFIGVDSSLFSNYKMENIGVFVDKNAETFFQSFCFKTTWKTNALNELLIEVANDNLRAFIIGKNCLICPYDGGMDLIFKDLQLKNFYKEKYKNWLSERLDGL